MIINYFSDNDFTITPEHDNLIISLLTQKNKDNKIILNTCRLKESWLKSRNIYNYIINRYKNVSDIQEILYLLINHYDEKSEFINCKTCGKQIIPEFKGFFYNGYKLYCSYKCSINDKNKTYKIINNQLENEITDETIINYVYDKEKNKLISSHLSIPHLKSMNYYDYIINRYNDNSNFKSLTQEVIYRMIHYIDKIPKCLICGNPVHFKRFTNGYRKYCSNSCALKSDNRKQLVRKTRDKTQEDLWLKKGYNLKYNPENNYEYIIYNKCEKHNPFIISKQMFYNRYADKVFIMCPICNPERNKETSIETIIKQLLDKHNLNYIQHTRDIIHPREVDFYLPEYKIAIECNGMFWHSGQEGKNLALLKYKLAEQNNITLLTFWEDDIKNKIIAIENILLSKLNKNNKIYARNCNIKEITSNESKLFLNQYHLQGNVNTKIKLGLFYNNELIQVMTFRHKRNIYELCRVCSKLNYTVVGGASKLLKYFIKHYNPDNIITYCNKEISNGNFYLKLGFNFIKNCGQKYMYYNRKISPDRIPIFKLRKNNISNEINKHLTTKEILLEQGYIKCYTAGILKYELKIN